MVNTILAPKRDANPQKRGAALRTALLVAAREVFLEDGFALASMDAVALRAGTTKRTLYAHCRCKEDLFAEVIGASCDAIVDRLPALAELDSDPDVGLRAFLAEASAIFEAEGCAPLKRIILAEAQRHPQFVRRLSDAYAQVEGRLATYLADAVDDGRLAPHDTRQASRALCDATVLAGSFRGLLGQERSSAADIENAAASFLRDTLIAQP
ncbi:TetR/AcrR family transcriptional regulator [Phenylobacterium immobile]|uniref:TetR/AcrR family transcriptional regulator n=1 Tax=Phenylobacterium immobile TaxID=21 RepID=UPI000AD03F04|nr:TetR/AcrR family transcriptional regulator [Phenylobacterium immobile]